MAHKIITYSFYILFFFTPLFFTPLNSELFEYNKMMLVYLLTTIIVGAWIIKMINLKSLIFNRTPIDIPILLFLLSQILSTIFSIDPHTSLWGYYSRSNGGLISIISYILLYYALVSNFDWAQAQKFLKFALWGGLAVSLYAIPEHFGVSPSCVLLSHTFSADCWVQDVQSRVFATLGQPNWLAAYLEMLIFPAIYMALTAKNRSETIRYPLYAIIYYLAFTFTYSRGAMLGFLAGIVVFVLFIIYKIYKRKNIDLDRTSAWIAGITILSVFIFLIPITPWYSSFLLSSILTFPFLSSIIILVYGIIIIYLIYRVFHQNTDTESKSIFVNLLPTILVLLLYINLLFGSALTGNFRLLKSSTLAARPGITQSNSVGTQLENGGTESGQIRLIVWKGALDIFKHYPLFGSGVETFAYSYYQFRPVEHNLVSEWDFLYNKAHNEYLNYLATTGLVGFVSYMLLIGTFLIWSIRKLLESSRKNQESKTLDSRLLPLATLSAYIAYLVQNFFGFSVVIIALFFFTFPAFAFLATNSIKPWVFSKNSFIYQIIQSTILRKKGFQTLTIWVVVVVTGLMVLTLGKYWWADTLYKNGQDYNDAGNPGKAYNILFDAASLNPNEPLYKAELGNAAASSAVALFEQDATTSAILEQQAVSNTQKAIKISPTNTSIWRTAIRTYYDLSVMDPSFEQKTLDTFDQTIKLAPTDPKLYYNKALVLEGLNKPDQEIAALKKAVELKPNYLEVILKLGDIYLQTGDYPNAKTQYEAILQLTPGDPGALDKLQQIATVSAKTK